MLEDKFTDPETLTCPYDYFDEIRAETPAFYSPTMQAYVVTRYADAMEVLNDPRTFSSEPSGSSLALANFSPSYFGLYEAAGVPLPQPTLVVTDGEAHLRYRRHIERFFNASGVRLLEEKVLVLVDMLIDEFIADGHVDLYRRFCLRLPLYVVCDMLGLPREDALLMQAAADASVRLTGAAGESEESRIALHLDAVRFHAYVAGHIARIRAQPDDTLLSAMIHTMPEDGRPMDDAEITSIVSALNSGGNETTTNGLGNMFLLALTQPQWIATLGADRALIPKFVEEALRVESPISAMPRWVTKDTKIGGVAIPAGSIVQVNFAASNRDDTRFACPAEVSIERTGLRNHFAFGMGPHYCLGAILARLELKLAMNRILDRLHDIRLATHDLRHRPRIVVRGLESLPILFTPAAPLQ